MDKPGKSLFSVAIVLAHVLEQREHRSTVGVFASLALQSRALHSQRWSSPNSEPVLHLPVERESQDAGIINKAGIVEERKIDKGGDFPVEFSHSQVEVLQVSFAQTSRCQEKQARPNSETDEAEIRGSDWGV